MPIKKFFSSCLGNLLVMFIVSIALFIGANSFLTYYTHHNEVVKMPDLRERTLSSSIHTLIDCGLEYEVVDTGYVKRLPANAILDQSILPGQLVKKGRKIELTINASGPKLIQLPDLVDKCSLREAELRLHALGFTNLIIEHIEGQRDHLYGIKINGRLLPSRARVSVDDILTLQVGEGYFRYSLPQNDIDSINTNDIDDDDKIDNLYNNDESTSDDDDAWWKLIESVN